MHERQETAENSQEGSTANSDGVSSDETDTALTRWWLTNDLLAGVLNVGYLAIVGMFGLGWLNVQTIPEILVLGLVVFVGVANTWAFGPDALRAWSKVRGK